MIRIILKLVFFIFVTQIYAQEKYPTGYFISPLEIPLKLSGTFGELRADHFHSGMDIKTGEVEGLNVHAVADGYVSRIKIQPGGYGKALYITHPNGFVSVYGHLSRYNDLINDYVTRKQYENETYEIDLFPDPALFPVHQGDIVAYSGDTGYSGGPHLHFEIRSEADQKPINPLLFGFKVPDISPPVINLLKIYPYGPGSSVKGRNLALDLYPVTRNKDYFIPGDDTIPVSGKVYFGMNTIDLFNDGANKNGVFLISVSANDKVIFEEKMITFGFDETRYINSLIDYKEYKHKNRRVYRSFIQPNNHLSIYDKVKNQGILSVHAGSIESINCKVADEAGNTSTLHFYLKGTEPVENPIQITSKTDSTIFDFRKKNNLFVNRDVKLEVPRQALYDTVAFEYKKLPGIKNSFSSLYMIHHDDVPLHTWCTLSIRCDSLPVHYRDKALIVKVNGGNRFKAAGGNWDHDFITTGIREFGNYCVMVDTMPPEIHPVNIPVDKSLATRKDIRIKITDDLSGIKDWRGTLNGKWILMEYDEKNDLLIYRFDDRLKKGENNFQLEVWDKRNNYANYQTTLTN